MDILVCRPMGREMAQVATTMQATWNQSPAVGVEMAAAATRFHAVSYIVARAMMMVQPSWRSKTKDIRESPR